jgi:hypothetical protein
MKLWVEDFTGAAAAHVIAATLNDRFPQLLPHLVSVVPCPTQARIVHAIFRLPDDLYEELRRLRANGNSLQDARGISLSGGADGVAFALDTEKP